MSQPPDQQPQWWQPQATPGAAPNQPSQGPQPDQQATGPHAGQWQQNAQPGMATGPYTGTWQPGPAGSFSGPWQQQPQAAPQPGGYGAQWQQQPPGAWSPQSAPHQPPNPGAAPPGQQQQFGGGFQPSAYGGLGVFAEAEKKPKSKKPLLIVGAAILVLAIGGGAAWLLGAFRGDTLEQKSLQDGVVKVLNENYGEPDVKNAECPSGESAKNGTTFDCTVRIGGQPKKVTVRVLNDRPEYEVSAPH